MSRKKFTRIKLGLLLNLIVGAVFILAAVLVVTLVNGQTRREALIEAKAKDTIILNRNLATHTYFSHQLKPKLFEWTEAFRDDDYFDPTWMSSTYAVREIDKYFQSLGFGGYYYKECAIDARSPENEADAYEWKQCHTVPVSLWERIRRSRTRHVLRFRVTHEPQTAYPGRR